MGDDRPQNRGLAPVETPFAAFHKSPMVSRRGPVSSTQGPRVLTDRALHENVVVAPPTDGTAGQPARRKLARARWAPPAQLDESPSVVGLTVERQDRRGARLDVQDMVAFAPVFVGVLER